MHDMRDESGVRQRSDLGTEINEHDAGTSEPAKEQRHTLCGPSHKCHVFMTT